MNVREIEQMNQRSLIDYLFGNKEIKKGGRSDKEKRTKRDSFEMSSAGAEMLAGQNHSTASRNRNIDESIDLLSYVEEARRANKEAVENAGNEIKCNNMAVYQGTYDVFKKALIDKYTKLAAVAKSHDDPYGYLFQKYRNKGCAWYAADLTDREREIAYRYEMQMLETGTIKGLKGEDSLFRGIAVGPEVLYAAEVAFNTQMVNAQIDNIFKESGIELGEGDDCTFSVDPYSYYISVSGVGEEMKQRMESALNVGENGKNLYFHIIHCATGDGVNSRQLTEAGMLKHRAYQKVLEYTGLELETLEERNGTYYTKEGKDICNLVCEAINASKEVPVSQKPFRQDYACELIHELAKKGRDTIRDMVLRIGYSEDGLMEKDQDISFSMKDESLRRMLERENYITI